MMNLRGEDTADALREWIKTDIAEMTKTGYDMGKFFFTAASGSIAILASLQKLDSAFQPTARTLSPYAFFTIALFLGLNLVLPRNRLLSGDTDLHTLYATEFKFIIRRIYFWCAAWFAGVLTSLWVILKPA
ncbi:MAG: hypothetical protein DME97_05040 [Verrucomicrobia bacterium]|nr:MAG: hypothetical protein DME97_05040 [Verrucomicrobiota bacterium]